MRKNLLFLIFFSYLCSYSQFGGDPLSNCERIKNWKAEIDCELGIVYLKGYTQGFNFGTINNSSPNVNCYMSIGSSVNVVNGQAISPTISIQGQFASNGYFSIPLIKDDNERTYLFDIGYFFDMNDPGGCKKSFSITIPPCKCGGKAIAEFTSIEEYISISDTPFGLLNIPVICETILDGSKSSCDEDYFISITKFNPSSWTNIGSPLFSGWFNGSAPSNIDLSQFASLTVNNFYMLQFAIGPDWDVSYKLFQKSSNSFPNCCLLNLYKNNETLTGNTQYIFRENIWACTNSNSSSDIVTVANNSNILFRAGKQITLAEGFNTQFGAIFLAEIVQDPCLSKEGKFSTSDKSNTILNEVVKTLNIYPNPTNGILNISLINFSNVNYELYALDGRLILNNEFKNVNEIKIDLSNNESGIYFINLNINGELISKKIIKQ